MFSVHSDGEGWISKGGEERRGEERKEFKFDEEFFWYFLFNSNHQ
jgi:hypothetical protein